MEFGVIFELGVLIYFHKCYYSFDMVPGVITEKFECIKDAFFYFVCQAFGKKLMSNFKNSLCWLSISSMPIRYQPEA